MHEYSIVSSLLERVGAEARTRNAIAVHRLTIKIGAAAGIDPDLLSKAYEMFREGTLCAGAELCVQRVEEQWACPECGRKIARGEILRCAQCATPARLVSGDEIILEQIEMEVP